MQQVTLGCVLVSCQALSVVCLIAVQMSAVIIVMFTSCSLCSCRFRKFSPRPRFLLFRTHSVFPFVCSADLFWGPDDGSAGLNGEDEYQHAHREEKEREEKMERAKEKGKEKEEKKDSKQAEAPKTWAQKIAAQKSDEKEVKTPAPAASVKPAQPAKVSAVQRCPYFQDVYFFVKVSVFNSHRWLPWFGAIYVLSHITQVSPLAAVGACHFSE